MILQLQISGEKFLTLVRERAKLQKICYAGTDFHGQAGKVLDHVEWIGGSSLQATGTTTVVVNLPGGNTQTLSDIPTFEVYQPIKVLATTLADLEAANPPQDEFPSHPSVKFRFSTQLPADSTQAPELCTEVFLPPGAEDVEPPKIQPVPIDLTAVKNLLGEFTVSNAGIALDSNGTFIAIRFEIGEPSPTALQTWTAFYNGQIMDRLQGHDWALFIDPGLIMPVVVAKISTGLTNSSDPHYDLQSGPNASWSSSSIVVECGGELVDACQCAWGEIDLDVDLTFTATFSVKTPDVLTIDVNVVPEATDIAEEACCIVTDALIGGALGSVALGGVGAVVGAIVGIVNLNGLGSGSAPPPDCQQVSDAHLACTQQVDLSLGGLGQLTLTSAVGQSDGLVLGGSMSIQEKNYPSLEQGQTDFTWGYPNCQTSTIIASASADLYRDPATSSPVPLFFCHALMLDDPPPQVITTVGGQYKTKEQSSGGTVGVEVTVSAPWANYPCKLLILTTLGARLFQIPAPTAISEEEQLQLFIQKYLACMTLTNSFWQTPIALVLTLPDPGPDLDVANLWQVLLFGVQPNETVGLHAAGGKIVATATPKTGGVAQLSAFVLPAQAGEELNLTHEGGFSQQLIAPGQVTESQAAQSRTERLAFPSGRGLAIKGVQLVREALLPLKDRGDFLSASVFRGAPSLFLWQSTGLRVYDVSTPNFPSLVHLTLVQGVSGHLVWQDRFLAWGEAGLVLFSRELKYLGEMPGAARGEPVLDAATTKTHLYVLAKNRVTIFNLGLENLGQLPVQQAHYLAVVANVLVVSNERGLNLFDLSHAPNRAEIGSLELEGAGELVQPRSMPVRNAVFVRLPQGGGSVFDLSRPNEPQEITRFAEDPWFVGSARVGRTFARLEKGRTALSVYTVWKAFEDFTQVAFDTVKLTILDPH